MAVELRIPHSGESITEVQIGAWRKAEGDYIQQDEIVAEIETDKASMELPAPVSGRITRLLKQAGEMVVVGEAICVIDEAAVAPAMTPGVVGVSGPAAGAAEAAARTGSVGRGAPGSTAVAAIDPTPRVMPAARRALAGRGLRPADVTPTGPGGRVLKEDVERRVREGADVGRTDRRPETGATERVAASGAPEPVSGAPAAEKPAVAGPTARLGARSVPSASREEEAVPMTMIRRRIAERLVQSQHAAALLTTFNEIDMSAVMALRKQRNDAFETKYGIKLGLMSFFVKAAIDALKAIPQVNAETRELPGSDGRPTPHIVYKNYYDIGVAVSTEHGLVVPVIRNAERLSFAEIELAIADLAARARDRKLALEELQGGTFTISNGGVFGSLLSTPIINPPQSGILGLHAIQDRPVARDGQVVIRPMMYVALTYDHRIIDGRESVTFLKRVKQCVEDPVRMLVEV
jgi:2-oxoglutarate dehydrogenase E2 component (dihydrolipoamide succinyltransferase)